jgi:hypothetical protein
MCVLRITFHRKFQSFLQETESDDEVSDLANSLISAADGSLTSLTLSSTQYSGGRKASSALREIINLVFFRSSQLSTHCHHQHTSSVSCLDLYPSVDPIDSLTSLIRYKREREREIDRERVREREQTDSGPYQGYPSIHQMVTL